MKSASVLACLVPLVAATWNLKELDYSSLLSQDYAEDSSDCEYPAYYTISNIVSSGASASNQTYVDFGFKDSETGVSTSCSANSTSTDIADDGKTPRYVCDDAAVEFVWKVDAEYGNKLTVVEYICNSTYTVSGSWIPTFSCQDGSSEAGVECKVSSNSTSYTGKYSSLEPITEEE